MQHTGRVGGFTREVHHKVERKQGRSGGVCELASQVRIGYANEKCKKKKKD